MKKSIYLLMTLISLNALAVDNKMVAEKRVPKFRKYTENFFFNYGMQYLGPSLSGDYQDGATYNRFKTGQSWNGTEEDATGSYQIYHTSAFGYNINQNLKLSYTYTFQDDVNDKIKYKSYNTDGSYSEYERSKGVSDNNKRLNLYVMNIYSNKDMYLSSNFFYEFPSTNTSTYEEREYGLGFEPTIGFNHSNSSLSTSLSASIQRNYFKQQEYYQKCGSSDCPIATRYQTLLVSISGNLNYYLNDYLQFKSSLTFDWDQKGDEVKSTEKYNKNMHDVARVGLDLLIDYGVSAGTFLEFGIEDAGLDKTAIGFNLNLNLY